MKSPVRVLPRTFHEGVSFAQPSAEILATSANSALMHKVALRALRLESARAAANAKLILAEDPASGSLHYQQGLFNGHWQLSAIYYECTHGRAPKATMLMREGPTFELTIDSNASSWELDAVEHRSPASTAGTNNAAGSQSSGGPVRSAGDSSDTATSGS